MLPQKMHFFYYGGTMVIVNRFLLNIFFCVQQNKETLKGLEKLENDQPFKKYN